MHMTRIVETEQGLSSGSWKSQSCGQLVRTGTLTDISLESLIRMKQLVETQTGEKINSRPTTTTSVADGNPTLQDEAYALQA
ncbi:hypothetical protein PoB_007673200 [Plakobranchus ocellatus]|uniref:Uncharacterized protein n=1 Tax=Plakobranchus ocellatus TaxID=259542 RepID=A0AAV4E1S2_9GAST|nr:hypothetical protein PoB_007673200 [Plakobranchus ocellatus]